MDGASEVGEFVEIKVVEIREVGDGGWDLEVEAIVG